MSTLMGPEPMIVDQWKLIEVKMALCHRQYNSPMEVSQQDKLEPVEDRPPINPNLVEQFG